MYPHLLVDTHPAIHADVSLVRTIAGHIFADELASSLFSVCIEIISNSRGHIPDDYS